MMPGKLSQYPVVIGKVLHQNWRDLCVIGGTSGPCDMLVARPSKHGWNERFVLIATVEDILGQVQGIFVSYINSIIGFDKQTYEGMKQPGKQHFQGQFLLINFHYSHTCM